MQRRAETDPVDPEITFEEIQSRRRDPSLLLVNVLSPEAFGLSRIPGSISLPLEEVPERAAKILPELDREIAIYCGGPT